MKQIIAFMTLLIADIGFSFRNALALGGKADLKTVEDFKDDIYPQVNDKISKEDHNRSMDKIELTMGTIQEEQTKIGKCLATLTERTKWIKEWKENNCKD